MSSRLKKKDSPASLAFSEEAKFILNKEIKGLFLFTLTSINDFNSNEEVNSLNFRQNIQLFNMVQQFI